MRFKDLPWQDVTPYKKNGGNIITSLIAVLTDIVGTIRYCRERQKHRKKVLTAEQYEAVLKKIKSGLRNLPFDVKHEITQLQLLSDDLYKKLEKASPQHICKRTQSISEMFDYILKHGQNDVRLMVLLFLYAAQTAKITVTEQKKLSKFEEKYPNENWIELSKRAGIRYRDTKTKKLIPHEKLISYQFYVKEKNGSVQRNIKNEYVDITIYKKIEDIINKVQRGF